MVLGARVPQFEQEIMGSVLCRTAPSLWLKSGQTETLQQTNVEDDHNPSHAFSFARTQGAQGVLPDGTTRGGALRSHGPSLHIVSAQKID